jgi:hypothetical protein
MKCVPFPVSMYSAGGSTAEAVQSTRWKSGLIRGWRGFVIWGLSIKPKIVKEELFLFSV